MSLPYRPEIDGLRALAVIPVVLYHAGIGGFGGGFVGVDIFFVISGFVITGSLCEDIAQNRFSIWAFYERRIRRIYPALLLVLTATLLAGLLLFSPTDLRYLSKSLVATVAFASNIEFYREAGYFDELGEIKPLLHTWSLAVEEQYYLVFPLLLALLKQRSPRLMAAVLALAAAASLLVSVWLTEREPSFNFFMPFTRMWELLVGAGLSLWQEKHAGFPSRRQEILAVAGLCLLALPVFLYTPQLPFPGITAMPPVLGAALVIYASPGTRVGRLLSARALVYVGLTSYSLYLWHWPLLVFARYANLGRLEVVEAGCMVALAFVLAALSLRYIERPLRSRSRCSARAVFVGAGAASVALMGVALIGLVTYGFSFRSGGPDPLIVASEQEAFVFQADPCLRRDGSLPNNGECRSGSPAPAPLSIALWGDSHAAQLVPVVDRLARERGLGFQQYTKAACLPVLAQRFEPLNNVLHDCAAFNRSVIADIERSPQIRILIIAGRWDTYIAGQTLALDDASPDTIEASNAVIVKSILRLSVAMERRAGHLIVINQVPVPPIGSTICLRAARFQKRDAGVCEHYPAVQARAMQLRLSQAIFEPLLSRATPMSLIATEDVFCTKERCLFVKDGAMVYLDPSHLSAAGANLLLERLAAALR